MLFNHSGLLINPFGARLVYICFAFYKNQNIEQPQNILTVILKRRNPTNAGL
jgi:hypothetical protein